ncbi:hypothetical protein NHX12_025987 [Muraenolepis orangiensis]|uniref:Uncharacterized protein n=1 Tax=Muraenolepis orangiensis TaxID=630683 RepID=A0A9Q0EIS4_9TELE|nr:hypothetical protein NHX12_025987 [Muraenolepis orangiensis]
MLKTTLEFGWWDAMAGAVMDSILSHSPFGEGRLAGTLDLPGNAEVPDAGQSWDGARCPYGYEAFPLFCYLMCLFPGSGIPGEKRVLKCRLGRASLTVECRF